MKRYVRFLFVVTCAVCVSCSPLATDDADTSPSANPSTKQFQGDLTSMDKTQNDSMTIRKKIRVLLLKQDYQSALNFISQFEKEFFKELYKEFFEAALRDKESLEKEKLKEEVRYAVLMTIRSTYNYLYQVLGQDKEALQKFKEIKLPTTTNPELLYFDCWEKLVLLGRLNMIDEMINEINTFFNNPNISMQSISPKQHAIIMPMLINAYLVKGDIESAQKNISQQWANIQRLPISNVSVQQEYLTFKETLLFMEYNQ